MKDVNKVILIGRLGADPIQRKTKTGVSVVHFSLATTRRFSKETKVSEGGEMNGTRPHSGDETQWHNIVCWGKQGENCALYLKKGNRVYVEGNLRCHQYEDKNGLKKTSVEIHAETVSFLSTTRTSPVAATA